MENILLFGRIAEVFFHIVQLTVKTRYAGNATGSYKYSAVENCCAVKCVNCQTGCWDSVFRLLWECVLWCLGVRTVIEVIKRW